MPIPIAEEGLKKLSSQLVLSLLEPDFTQQTTGIKMKNMPKLNTDVVASSDGYEPLTVETVYNHIYFYSEVTSDRSLALMRQLRQLDNQLQNERLQRNMPDGHQVPIWLHIQSPGGGLFPSLAVADQLKQITSPVYSIVEGYCGSSGTLISMSCAKRFIQPSSFMLIHQLSGAAWGTYEELKDNMDLQNMLMDKIIQFYVQKSNLDEPRVREILKRDTWLDAQRCLEYGLVDEIVR